MNSNNKLKVRYHDLDALRSFAMILGIAIHGVFSFNGMPIWPAQDINQNPQYGVVAEFIHGFRMQLFFLVSGFFTAMMLLKKGSFQIHLNDRRSLKEMLEYPWNLIWDICPRVGGHPPQVRFPPLRKCCVSRCFCALACVSPACRAFRVGWGGFGVPRGTSG